MATHRIQLKGPWDVRLLDENVPPRRVFMPMSWREIFGTTTDRAEFRRKFNQPTNLEDHEQVWVVFDGIGGEGSVRLNGHDLGAIAMTRSTAEFDITRQLALHNELVVELAFRVDGDSDALGGLWGLVALEIRFDDDAASLPVTDRTAG